MSLNGFLIVDKPAGFTSHDVVARVRRILGERSVGHLGTLDPMATGVLPLVLGNMTRLAQFYGDSVKGYDGEIRFGFSTNTYDAEGEESPSDSSTPVEALTLENIRAAAIKFTGAYEQMPPQFSAKKIHGVPAYKLARKNQEVVLAAVPIEVHDFEIIDYSDGRAHFRSLVSSGTYIRCLAHELGQALGTGAHLSALRRTRVAEFGVDDARTLAEIEANAADPECLFVHTRKTLPQLPAVTATEDQAAFIRNGRPVNLPELSKSKLVKVFAGQRELLAIASRIAGTLFQPKVVLKGD